MEVEAERFSDGGRTVAAAGVARGLVSDALRALGFEDLDEDAALVASELVTNAVLHGDGVVGVRVEPLAGGVRISVEDRSRTAPAMALVNRHAMTGRGLRLVSALTTRWAAEATDTGKVVWAELARGHAATELTEDELLEMWDDAEWLEETSPEMRHRVVLGDVPTQLLIEAKTHVDNLVREFTLTATGAATGATPPLPLPLATLVETVVTGFADARSAIKRQAVEAARRGDGHVRLELSLPPDAAEAGLAYLDALDEADTYSRATRLLTLETPPQHRVFRQWYVGEIVRQLRAVRAGEEPPPVESFEERLLREIDAAARARGASERDARLYEVAAALSRALTPEDVAGAVLDQGVAALGAAGAGLLLASAPGTLEVPGTLGYDDALVAQLRAESPDAELPAATALRTGEPVWLESSDEIQERFPQLRQLEPETVSLVAVPLVLGGRRLGALRFSFRAAQLFDEQQRRFVAALADQASQALDRSQLHAQRLALSRRLQRSLLPGRVPTVPGVEVAAIHHPLGDGMELGGDFYDVWAMADGRFAFALGDACGTGPEAAALSAMVRFTLQALLSAGAAPDEALSRLNEAMLADADADASSLGERFCTAVVGIVAPGDDPHVLLASGGHPFPLVRRGDGPTEEVPLGGSLLGVLAEPAMATCEVVLRRGDVLVVVTDGALEARRDGEMLGVEGVAAAIDAVGGSAADIAAAIEAAVVEHSRGAPDDDVAALVLRAT